MTSLKLFVTLIFCLPIFSLGQPGKKVEWQFNTNAVSGNEAMLVFTANLEPGWHLYSQFLEDGGPIPTRFVFESSGDYQLLGEAREMGHPTSFRDDTFEMDITWYSGTVSFLQKVRLNKTPTKIRGRVEFMVCNDSVCVPDKQDFVFDLK